MALAGNSHAAVLGNGARPRGSRQGSEAVRPGIVVPRSLPKHLHQAVWGRSQPDDSSRYLGILSRPDRHGDVVWRLRVDRALGDCDSHHTRTDDDVSDAVPPGTVGGVRDLVGGWRDV